MSVAMQVRCIYCQREQYLPAVHAISYGEAGCAWCGRVPPVLTETEYREQYRAGLNGPVDPSSSAEASSPPSPEEPSGA